MKIKKYINSVLDFIFKILFPPRCVFCESVLEPLSKIHVCGNCSKDIKFCEDSVCCVKCGKPIISFGKKQLCYFCLNKNAKYFDRIISVFTYEGLVRDSVLRFKTSGLTPYTETFAECMYAKIVEEYDDIKFDLLCGVMQNDNRKSREKGFDQVDLICRMLSTKLDISYEKQLFKRMRKTDKQSELGWRERQNNIKDSVMVSKSNMVSGKTILLIDDVCTTRSTLIEYSRALKSSGAKRVYAVTVATVQNPKC